VNSTVKTVMFWVFILICLMLLWSVVQRGTNMGKDAEIPYSDLFDKAQAGLVQDASIEGNELHGHLKATPKEQFHTTIPANYEELEKALRADKVALTIKTPQNNILLPILFNVGPFILLGAIWFFMLRQMQSGATRLYRRQEPGAAAFNAAEKGHLQGCGRRG